MIREDDKADLAGVLVAIVVLALCLSQTGCGLISGEVYLGSRRIDEVEQKQIMRDKSWRDVVWGNGLADQK